MIFRKALSAAFLNSWWPVIIAATLAVVVVYQSWLLTHPYRRRQINMGERLSQIPLRVSSGEAAVLKWGIDSRPTILYIFRPDCPWCRRNRESVALLLSRAVGYRIVLISLSNEGLAQYVRDNALPYPTFYIENPTIAAKLKLFGTPQTIVTRPDGVVEKVWDGAYMNENAKEIEAAFGVKLPNITSTWSSPSSGLRTERSRPIASISS